MWTLHGFHQGSFAPLKQKVFVHKARLVLQNDKFYQIQRTIDIIYGAPSRPKMSIFVLRCELLLTIKLLFLSVKLPFLSVKLSFLSVKFSFLFIKLFFLSIKFSFLSITKRKFVSCKIIVVKFVSCKIIVVKFVSCNSIVVKLCHAIQSL